MGPYITDKPLENFTIMLTDENAVCVMNSSAQFSKMSVDYYYEKPKEFSNDFIITLFIEGLGYLQLTGGESYPVICTVEGGVKNRNRVQWERRVKVW